MLDDWERGRSLGLECVIDLPDALRRDVVKTAPSSAPTTEEYRRIASATRLPSPPPDASTRVHSPVDRLLRRFSTTNRFPETPRLQIPNWLDWRTGDYAHQGEAVRAWERAGERGTISMATGAGKTFTSLVCATRVQERLGDKPLLIVVSAPSVPLIEQWKREIKTFGVDAVTPTTANDKRSSLTDLLRSLGTGGVGIAVVTNNLLRDAAFQRTIVTHIQHLPQPIATMLIGDEAHTLGAKRFLANQPDFFERRLALSATPERQYDPDGTEKIFEFFGPEIYRFGLDRAIGFCLVPYDYYVHVAVLDSIELEEFNELTHKIGRAMAWRGDDEDDNSAVERLLIMRRRVIETARAKLPLLRKVVHHRGPRSLTQSLVYASAKNPAQFDNIVALFKEAKVRWAPVTQETTANPRLLRERLETFSIGGYQVLIAKKVLDEGVDIPSTREAFLIASSTVEREWVQRRGRILRRHPDKPHAVLHDFLSLPPVSVVRGADALDKDLRKIVQRELSRAYSFAAHARNAPGGGGVVAHLERIKSAYWPKPGGVRPSILRSANDYLLDPSTPKGALW